MSRAAEGGPICSYSRSLIMPHLTADALHTDPEGLAILRVVLRHPRTRRAAGADVTALDEARRTARKPVAPSSMPLADEAVVGVTALKRAARS
jgi:hypothetical protein